MDFEVIGVKRTGKARGKGISAKGIIVNRNGELYLKIKDIRYPIENSIIEYGTEAIEIYPSISNDKHKKEDRYKTHYTPNNKSKLAIINKSWSRFYVDQIVLDYEVTEYGGVNILKVKPYVVS